MKFTIRRREFNNIDLPKGSVVVIGNFDGVHKGHKELINKGLNLAKEHGLTSVVYTFEPHPKKLFMGELAPKPLMRFSQKSKYLKKMGVDLLVARPFTKELSKTSFEEFAEHLKNDIHAKIIVVGEDFTFGKNREGTAAKLKKYGQTAGFDVVVVPDIGFENEGRVSSSLIRNALEKGHVKQATQLLEKPFSVSHFLAEDDNCNLVINFSSYTSVKNGVYWVKIKYTNERLKGDVYTVPLKIEENIGYIAPLPELPDLPTGNVILSLIDKIEE